VRNKEVIASFKDLAKDYDSIVGVEIEQTDITLRINYYCNKNITKENTEELFNKTKEHISKTSIQTKIKNSLRNTYYYRTFKKNFNDKITIYFKDSKSKKEYRYETKKFHQNKWTFSYLEHDGESYNKKEEYELQID